MKRDKIPPRPSKAPSGWSAMLPSGVKEVLPIVAAVGGIGAVLLLLQQFAKEKPPGVAGVPEGSSTFSEIQRLVTENRAPLGLAAGGAVVGGLVSESRFVGAGAGAIGGLMAYGLYSALTKVEAKPVEPTKVAKAEPVKVEVNPTKVRLPEGFVPQEVDSTDLEGSEETSEETSEGLAEDAALAFAEAIRQRRPDVMIEAIDDTTLAVRYPTSGKTAPVEDVVQAQRHATQAGVMLDTIRKLPDGSFSFPFRAPTELVSRHDRAVRGLALNRPPPAVPYRSLAMAAR